MINSNISIIKSYYITIINMLYILIDKDVYCN